MSVRLPPRSTYGAQIKRKLPSSSESSKSAYFLEELVYFEKYSGPPALYQLSEVTGSAVTEEAHKQIAEYLVSNFKISSDHVVCDNKIKLEPNIDPQHISRCKIPDVSILSGNCNSEAAITLVQIEVESQKSWESTIRKLAIGLVHQLTSQRNWDDTLTRVTGFYFPRSKEECVVKVEVEWNDKDLCFVVHHTDLELCDVKNAIETAYSSSKRGFENRTFSQSNSFHIPLSRTFIEAEFGHDVYQIPSRFSIVLADERRHKLWKYPFSSKARANLMFIFVNYKEKLRRSEVPRSIKMCGVREHPFFEYKLHKFPYTREEAKEHLCDFIQSVISAIEELHLAGLVHLDIRLDNICLSNDENRAILVDLDRARSKMAHSRDINTIDSVMYDTHLEPATRLDWRQLGIMISYILSKDSYDYHKVVPPVPQAYEHSFLQKLINEGEYNQGMFKQWSVMIRDKQ